MNLSRYRLDPTVLLIALLVAVNLGAVIGLVTARRDARRAVQEGLELEIRADARALEARLAAEHDSLDFLARSAPFSSLPTDHGVDPVARRWARLELEATLLLYLRSNPAVTRLRVRDRDGVLAVAQRDGKVPTLAVPDDPLPLELWLLRATWPLDGSSELEAWLDTRPLVADLGSALELHRTLPADPQGPLEAVTSDRWQPPLKGWLERTESDTRVLGAVDRLAGLYRGTLILNVALLPVTLLLGALTVRRARRLASLESERRQRERLRTLEMQVQHSERLASLGRFAAGTAHEINNPLAGMTNYLQLLREDLEIGRIDQAREWVPRLDEGIDRVAGIVRQVLHFAEPGAAAHESVDLAEVIERTVLFLNRHPECRDATVRIHCEGDLRLEGDAVGLGQLVLNLVLNACQAVPEGASAEVDVDAREGDLDGDTRNSIPGGTVVLRVLDRGSGIVPEMRDRLFEPFQSGRDSSGLGLAVCHGIVGRHRGTIEAFDRVPGPGTELRVRLPRRADETETTGSTETEGEET